MTHTHARNANLTASIESSVFCVARRHGIEYLAEQIAALVALDRRNAVEHQAALVLDQLDAEHERQRASVP